MMITLMSIPFIWTLFSEKIEKKNSKSCKQFSIEHDSSGGKNGTSIGKVVASRRRVMATRSGMTKPGQSYRTPHEAMEESVSVSGEGSNTGRRGTSVLEQKTVPRGMAEL